MAYAVIELLSLNFALNPLFCKTDVICCAFVTLICKYSEKSWRFFFSVGFFDCFIGLKYLIRNFLLCSEVELFSCLWQVECIDIAQGL